jgi:hypothetical protein
MSNAAGMPSPDLFFDAAFGYVRTEVLGSAVELDVFSAVAAGSRRSLRLHSSAPLPRKVCVYCAITWSSRVF